ncbi:MAG: M1 family metallopeptidase [Terriglobales bacterium]
MLGADKGWAQDDSTLHNAMSPVSPPGPLPEPFRIGSPRPQTSPNVPSAAALLYRQLRDVHLNSNEFHHVRDASIEREDIHITLDDGEIAFTQAVNGRITGAFFEGEGEILLIPPDRVERRSLALFTDSAVLEEKFTTAFFRFNDDFADDIANSLRPSDQDAQAFVKKWSSTVTSLAEADALRLLTSFLNGTSDANGKVVPPTGDHMLRVRIGGVHLGVFDLFFDTDAREQISVGQLDHDSFGNSYFNVWAAFPMRSMRVRAEQKQKASGRSGITPAALGSTTEQEPEDRLHISGYKIKVDVKPPTDLEVDCTMEAEVAQGGQRVILLELSRYLKVRQIELDSKATEFLQNEALEGTALARRGNDMVAVIFPETLRTGQKLQLHFVYGGSVMSEAGGGLLYVGARGIWFPNRGVSMANFDLEFTYPHEWSLVATGRQVSSVNRDGLQTSRWVSERPIPLAGFNLGHYQKADASGTVPVEVYASQGVETAMGLPKQETVVTPLNPRIAQHQVVSVAPPAPASNAQVLAEHVEKGVTELAQEIGPYPYSSLVISQMPGPLSQGWPGLIFLSSYAFLTPEEMQRTKLGTANNLLFQSLMPLHEVAHNWWGDLVVWKSYRDQWLVEALANYCALVAMEKNGDTREVQSMLDSHRRQLLSVNKDKRRVMDAGPVTLGVRLYSSYFPNGYDVISYGRGTWLFHMLRHMLKDAAEKDVKSKVSTPNSPADEPFFRVLRLIRERNEGKYMNNRIVQQAFEDELPESLRFEGKKSLDWFFDEWVNGTAIPKIEVTGVKLVPTVAGTVITGKITQKEAPDELVTSVPIYGVTSGMGSVLLGRVFADGPETAFRLVAPGKVKKIEVDPRHTVLRRD